MLGWEGGSCHKELKEGVGGCELKEVVFLTPFSVPGRGQGCSHTALGLLSMSLVVSPVQSVCI